MKINELYRSLILKHYKNPLNRGLLKNNLKNYFFSSEKNLSCGDEIIIQILVHNRKIVDIRYEVEGCSILVASSSLMSVILKNEYIETASQKINNFCNMLQKKSFKESLICSELKSFKIIQHFPGRIFCAIMPWTLLLKIINKNL
ncbi:SUF system NifU family Fe-S cluster assembly protein [Texas Phoenix palm phytoplasma]|uniref:SUF system NifU family Fe-S cluster assembly protein n=1 Tax=Texas Phoenix palm phytoplasma TaxID=176709 RepID=A0ABS5BIJ2_9MOLU|nr:SUF system NifU family Fe-S cluster assembly protein [Texas Phoenix palm phytoplasma]MBP3059369.1 SUF system NifU family Fe-S cluster assembly protein [Texas Phoenix palm phytoplasma]